MFSLNNYKPQLVSGERPQTGCVRSIYVATDDWLWQIQLIGNGGLYI